MKHLIVGHSGDEGFFPCAKCYEERSVVLIQGEWICETCFEELYA